MKKLINEVHRMQQLAGIRPINEEKEPIKTFFFGYDLDAIQAVSDYIRSKYKVISQHEWDGGEGVDAVEWVEMGDDTMASLDVHNPAMLQDKEFLSLVAAAEEGEDDRDEISLPLMEEDQDVVAKVDKAIVNNFQELSKALKDRKANKEDIDAHDAVKAAVIKIAKEVGIKDAESTPWMEEEMFSGALSPKQAIEAFRDMLEDTLEDTMGQEETGEMWKKVNKNLGLREEDQAVTDYPDTDEKGVETAIPGDESSAVLDEYESFKYDTPNLDVRGVVEDEAELNDLFLQHRELDLPRGVERLEDLEEILGKQLPKIFTFVIQGNFSDYDSVYDVGDGTIVYQDGYEGYIGLYNKDVLAKVIAALKAQGAKPYVQGGVVTEYEVIYIRGNDGRCYRVDDEGNRKPVPDHFCGRDRGNEVR